MEEEVEQLDDESVEESPAEPVKDKPESAGSLTDELMSFGDDDEPADDEATDSSSDEPAAPSGSASIFDTVLPDDPRLPKPYRGKVTVGQLFENERKLVSEFQSAREEANTLKTKLLVQNSLLENLQTIGRGTLRDIEQQNQQPPSEEEIWRYYGIEDINAEWFDNPAKVQAAMFARLRDEQAAITQPVVERVQQWDQTQQAQREDHYQQAAWKQAREVLKDNGEEIDPDVWVQRSPEVIQMVAMDRQRWYNSPEEQARRPDPAIDPVAYAAAYKTVMQRWEPRAVSAPPTSSGRGTTAPKNPQVSNPPHASRSAGTATAPSPKVSSRMEAEIKEWAKEWKMPVEQVREIFLEVESEGGR